MDQRKQLETLTNRREVLRATGYSPRTLWRHCKDGSFPVPTQTSPNRLAWLLGEVETWQRERVRARGEPER